MASSAAEAIQRLKKRYDGYHFSARASSTLISLLRYSVPMISNTP